MARNVTPPQSRAMAKAVGKTIRKHRLARALSQEAFADLIGVHRTQVGFLERGENTASIYALAVLASGLKMRASELLREAGF